MVASFKTNLLDWLKTKVYVKNEIDTKLQNKSDTNHTHTTATVSANGLMSKADKSKLDGIATEANKTVVDSSLSSSSTNPVQNKVVNSALNGKANSSHSHSISNITNLQSALDSKSETGHTHDDRYYTETEIDSKLNGKANSSHTHDDRYYTETEMNTKLNGKADINHRHNDVSILNQVNNDWAGLPVWYMIKNGWCILQWENPLQYLLGNNISVSTNSWFKLGNVPAPQTGRAVYQQLTTGNSHIRIQVTSGGVLQAYRTGDNVWTYGTLVYPTTNLNDIYG